MENASITKGNHFELLHIFGDEFEKVYRHMEPSCHGGLLELASVLFHKWYVSTLVSETILSPANIISRDLQNEANSRNVYAYHLVLDKKRKGTAKFNYALHTYSTKQHPIIEDLKLVTEYCLPDLEMDEKGGFLPEDRSILLARLSQQDSFYLEYLTILAWQLDLIKVMPSIHSKRVQAVAHYAMFFSRPTKEILLELTDLVLDIVAERFTIAMGIDRGIITKESFRPYLLVPQESNKIFADIYQMINIDIEEVWKNAAIDNPSGEEASVLSSFFFMGILLDKWFLTPLDSFLHVIQPLYYMPYCFISVLNNLSSLLIMENDVSMELYTPCSHYSLTSIGEDLFLDGASGENTQEMPRHLDFKQIMTAIDHELKTQVFDKILQEQSTQEIVYTFKVKYAHNKRHWKVLEFLSDIRLSDFCRELSMAFGFENVEDYTLTILDHNEFPMDYSPYDSKKSVNKAELVRLSAFSLPPGRKLFFTPAFDKKRKLELELLKTEQRNPYVIYPRIQRQSAFITREEKIEDFF